MTPNAGSGTAFDAAVEYLAYEMWGYEQPNEGAATLARGHLMVACEAFEAVRTKLSPNDGSGT